ncbi:MAG TPA: ABC transporter substrate-binding protein [Puia sp.]|jgi:branched-chain amino acid transport system substrate-binding protein
MKPIRIGLLLPRSTDYPAMGFEILDGLRCGLKLQGVACDLFSENTGFGEDQALTWSKAEKLLIQDNADLLVVYSGSLNAESLYPLADAAQKPFIILDAGMQLPLGKPSPYCFHISLQGLHACRLAGFMAGTGNRKVLMATSFYDGGYRGPFSYDRGLSEAGGAVCGNFVSGYKITEFNIDNYLFLLQRSEAAAVAACFSTYLAELFFKALGEKHSEATPLPFYCSPFMAEEQLLGKCDFPGGEFHAIVPWATSLQNKEQEQFIHTIREEKNKTATIFHLLGWEAAIAATAAWRQGALALKGFCYSSPRGEVTIHPETHYSFAPLYKGKIARGGEGKCTLEISEPVPVDAAMHMAVLGDRPDSVATGWTNDYLCI